MLGYTGVLEIGAFPLVARLGLDAWPPELRGKVLEVTGKVIHRADLSVFVHPDGEPERAGIAVGPGPISGGPGAGSC